MYGAIVAHANEKPAAVGVGEGGDGACQLHGVGDFVFEVLLLVLALGDKVLNFQGV